MGPCPSIDVGLNLFWAVLSLVVLLCWDAEWTQQSRRALVAILCVLVLLFPAISVADDITELSLTYDTAPSLLSVKSGKEIKHIAVPAPPAVEAAHGPVAQSLEALGDVLGSATATGSLSLLLASASGIHSPPQF